MRHRKEEDPYHCRGAGFYPGGCSNCKHFVSGASDTHSEPAVLGSGGHGAETQTRERDQIEGLGEELLWYLRFQT